MQTDVEPSDIPTRQAGDVAELVRLVPHLQSTSRRIDVLERITKRFIPLLQKDPPKGFSKEEWIAEKLTRSA